MVKTNDLVTVTDTNVYKHRQCIISVVGRFKNTQLFNTYILIYRYNKRSKPMGIESLSHFSFQFFPLSYWVLKVKHGNVRVVRREYYLKWYFPVFWKRREKKNEITMAVDCCQMSVWQTRGGKLLYQTLQWCGNQKDSFCGWYK